MKIRPKFLLKNQAQNHTANQVQNPIESKIQNQHENWVQNIFPDFEIKDNFTL